MELFKVLAALCLVLAGQSTATYCDSIQPPVPPCPEKSPRDLLFLVDGSNSMNRDRFFNEMLNYCLALYCAFDTAARNQAGMIVFNENVKVYVPLAEYTQDQWSQQVETVRATKDGPLPACCSCCTPTAEAFDQAGLEFAARGKNDIQIAFTITDGVPSNNVAGSGGNPLWWYVNPTVGFDPAVYNMNIVPTRATALKSQGIRIFLVGVPNKDGAPPDQKYFAGGYPANSQQCTRRDLVEFCGTYRKPPFPIVSTPVGKNSFSTNTWNVQSLITQTVGALCEIPPTPAPTRAPTTKSPTSAPSKGPTFRPTSQKPSLAPTNKPSKTPSTSAPSKIPTKSPTFVFMDQLDLTFIVDRSNSMNWHDDVCKQIIDSAPKQGDSNPKSYCWELFLRYILAQTDEIIKVKAGVKKDRPLGWANQFPGAHNPAKGLRVNIIGFACQNDQKTPLMFPYSRTINSGPINSRETLLSVLENMRTTVVPSGGTCPGLAIEQAVKQIESTVESDYPLQSTLLITDGVFYDMPFPARAVEGLQAYKSLQFAVGIAVANQDYSYGLTPEEIKTQRKQLRSFVGFNDQLFKNLGTDGWAALPQIAHQIAEDLPDYFYQGQPIPRYSWCGYRRIFSCNQDNWRFGHCQWTDPHSEQWACAPKA